MLEPLFETELFHDERDKLVRGTRRFLRACIGIPEGGPPFVQDPGSQGGRHCTCGCGDDCAGVAADASTLKRLSKLTYGELGQYEVPSYYKLCAISKAAGILAARKKSIRRGFPTKTPYLSKPILVSCYGFKIEDGSLLLPLGDRKSESIPLTRTPSPSYHKHG